MFTWPKQTKSCPFKTGNPSKLVELSLPQGYPSSHVKETEKTMERDDPSRRVIPPPYKQGLRLRQKGILPISPPPSCTAAKILTEFATDQVLVLPILIPRLIENSIFHNPNVIFSPRITLKNGHIVCGFRKVRSKCQNRHSYTRVDPVWMRYSSCLRTFTQNRKETEELYK